MDWTNTNDFGSEENYSDYSSLETEGNIDYGNEQRDSRPQQDPNQPNNALGDNRAHSSNSKQAQSYANQMENASKALAIAFQDAQRLPQNNSFALNNSERHVNPRNHNLLGLGFHDSSQAAINPRTSINKLLSDTDRLINGVQQVTNQQHQPSRDQNYGLNGRQLYEENLIGVAAPEDAQNSADPLGIHLVRPDDQSSDRNFAQLRVNSRRLQVYSDASSVLDNLLGADVNAQNLVGAPSANFVRNENSVTDGSHTSSFDISRSGSSSHPSIGDTRSQSHLVNPQRGGFDAASLSTFGASGELRSNFRQAQNQSNFFFPGLSRNHGLKDGLTPPVFNADTNSQKHNHQPTHNPRQSSRNEREQQRAAKISEVIDKLRNTMVQGGWKVEMKSKYQVLSTSVEYLQHLIESTKEKESELVKTKEGLAMRNQKLDEDRALQDGSTDDSLTSSLTQSFAGTHSLEERWKGKIGIGDSSTDVAVASLSPGKDSSKRKIPNEWSDEGDKTSKREKNCDDDSNHGSNSSGNLDSKNVIAMHKMSSSLSDVTDSNRCSSDGQGTNGSSDGQGGAGGKEIKASFDLSFLAKAESDTSKTTENSVSTTGAVVSGEDELIGEYKHTIIFTKDRKRKYSEKTSMDEDFQLSYQEIFLASNVPQLIATPSGRIVACNDFFFRVTGLTEKDVKKITIFSMVQVDHLSALFELVAEALRSSNTRDVSNTSSTYESSKQRSITDSNTTSNSGSSNCNSQENQERSSSDSGIEENETSNEPLQFETVTLPCVPFPNVLTN